MTSSISDEVRQRRYAFINHLYGLQAALSSDRHQAARARQDLARLRRSLGGPRQEAEAYEIVFRHDPVVVEQQTWLLVAGLFGLYPHAGAASRLSMGGALKELAKERQNLAERQMRQLVSVEPAALPYHLRRAIQLLKTEQVAVDFHRLLDDLLKVLNASMSDPRAHGVRLQWARDFHRPDPKKDQL